jgi:hypothetical protein
MPGPASRVFSVTLRAAGIQVTAEGESQARRYALDDARDFLQQHNYTVDEIAPCDLNPDDTDGEEARVEVELTECGPNRGAGLWTFDATVCLPVPADDEAEAVLVAAARLELEGVLTE